MDSQQHNETVKRWNHLLQPIRDLSQNWNIDIAKELEEYLIELNEINLSVDGVTTLNFAEAALLIQGSVGIYSKKVEYLYSLIFQTLDYLISHKKKKKDEESSSNKEAHPSSIKEDGTDTDLMVDDEPELLQLDDIEEGTNKQINLNESNGNCLNQNLRDSINSAMATAALSFSQESGENEAYHLNLCTVSSSGALLLGQTADFLNIEQGLLTSNEYERDEIYKPSTTNNKDKNNDNNTNSNNNNNDTIKNDKNSDQYTMDMSLPPSLEEVSPPLVVPPVTHQEEEDDDGDGGADGALGTDGMNDSNDLANVVKEVKADRKTSVIPFNSDVVVDDGDGSGDGGGGYKKKSKESRKSFVDPWMSLDPHDPGNIVSKPFVKGKCSRMPLILLHPSTATHHPSPTLKTSTTASRTLQWLDFETISGQSSRTLGPFFKEFDYLFRAEVDRRKSRLALASTLTSPSSPSTPTENNSNHDPKVSIVEKQMNLALQEITQENEHPLENPPEVAAADINDDDDDDDAPPPLPLDSQVSSGNTPPASADTATASGDVGTDKQIEVQSYEDLCRLHFEKFANDTEGYTLDTEQSKAVQNWKTRIKPILEEQENRPRFDIRKYAKVLLDSFSPFEKKQHVSKKEEEDPDLGKVANLNQIIQNVPQYEVCRKFLTALHLVNSGNLQFAVAPRKEHNRMNLEGDLIEVTLLSKKAPVDFESYRAPSLKQKEKQKKKHKTNNGRNNNNIDHDHDEREDNSPVEDEVHKDEEDEDEEQQQQKHQQQQQWQQKNIKSKNEIKMKKKRKNNENIYKPKLIQKKNKSKYSNPQRTRHQSQPSPSPPRGEGGGNNGDNDHHQLVETTNRQGLANRDDPTTTYLQAPPKTPKSILKRRRSSSMFQSARKMVRFDSQNLERFPDDDGLY